MNILSFTREQVEEAVRTGWMNKKSLDHYDICKQLSQGKTQSQIAESLNIPDDRQVRYVKKKKCPDCTR